MWKTGKNKYPPPENLPNYGLYRPGRLQSEIKGKRNWRKAKREISIWTLLEKWKTMEHESDNDTNCNRHTRHSPQRIGKRTRRIENKNSSGDRPNNNTVKIGQNTEKSSEDFRRLAVIQTSVKEHQLMLV